MNTKQTNPRSLNWLLNPGDDSLRRDIGRFVDELREFEGRKYGEFFEEVEEKNRLEKREAVRKLRVEVARLLAETDDTFYEADITPADIRLFIFQSLWKRERSFITSETDLFNPAYDELIAEAAAHFNVPEDTIRSSFHADIPEERYITLPDIPDPAGIIRMINTRRLKQMLRGASSLTVRFPGSVDKESPYVSLFRTLKRLGLMYDAHLENSQIVLNVTGPLALLERTTVYGNRFASFVVEVLNSFPDSKENNTLRIEVHTDRASPKKKAAAVIDSSYAGYFARTGSQVDDKLLRSGDEVAFQKYFEKAAPDWHIVYEGTIMPLYDEHRRSRGVFIPDFAIRKEDTDREILIEIVGYWREEYLKRKIEKMEMISGRDVYFFINAQLKTGGAVEDLEKHVFPGVKIRYYSGRRDLKRVVQEMAGEVEGS